MRNPSAGEEGALELWGGVECTVNRVGDAWYDQLVLSGHRERIDDLDRFAALGVRALRHPVLWETHVSGDWSWADASLARLSALGVAPIVGLVHHGSGPPGTSLVDEGFAEGLAAHAARVARRYPWVDRYTPVNEPLTTARFSALYGLWYPHARDDLAFVRALFNQCRATVLAMREIRKVNPHAKLVQTDDLGHTYGTAPLAYQCELENERRWIAWDLLCGRVDYESPVIRFLLAQGVDRGELQWFEDNPCPPDVVGVNHYVTSDRFLDHRVGKYPGVEVGGNGRDRYVDVEAIRVHPEIQDGWRRCLREAWHRYRLPLAITEAHLGCTRDEQIRWIGEAWSAACEARSQGADVRAVTAWALLGSFNWNTLLTRDTGHYEPGAFDVRCSPPRPTAIAGVLRSLADRGVAPEHPLGSNPGWWRRPVRFLESCTAGELARRAPAHRRPRRPVLITGAAGNLGTAFAHLCELRGLDHHLVTRREFDICSMESVEEALRTLRPWAVVNTAGYVRVDEAERDEARCFRENVCGAATLATACARAGVRFATFSTDLVFDGERSEPYLERSPVAPLNAYGRSKAQAERDVLREHPEALVVRTSSFFGPWHPHDFLTAALRALSRRERFEAIEDVVVSPTYVPDLVNACLDLLIDGESGLWHLANRGAVSWLELAQRGAALVGVDARGLVPRRCADLALPARRPAFSALATERGLALPSLDDALARYVREGRELWTSAA